MNIEIKKYVWRIKTFLNSVRNNIISAIRLTKEFGKSFSKCNL